jgi:hypothetical protein
MIHVRGLLRTGFLIWISATAYLRLDGQRLLRSRSWVPVLLLFMVSFAGMALLARRLCRAAQLPREQWPTGAIALALPTLVLDSFSTALFPAIFPNIAPEMAGVFGGWMLICCAGALLGVLSPRSEAQST